MKILVTGVAGSGKSTISRALRERGYAAYDIEEIDGLFAMYDTKTGERITDHSNDDLEQVQRADWNCDIGKLQELMKGEAADVAFYCGAASNWKELLPLFDKVLVLVANPEVTRERLSARSSEDFGNTADVQDWVLSWKDWWEDQMGQQGAEFVRTDQAVEGVVNDVLERVSSREHRESPESRTDTDFRVRRSIDGES